MVIASDNDEMVTLSEMEHLFRSVKPKIKKFRVARGTHSQERPFALLTQCVDFIKLVFKMAHKTSIPDRSNDRSAIAKENGLPERWANDVSEIMEEAQPPRTGDDLDPWDMPKSTIVKDAFVKSVNSAVISGKEVPVVNVSLKIKPVRHPDVHKVEITMQDMKPTVAGSDKYLAVSNISSRKGNHGSSLEIKDLNPALLESRALSRGRTPGNVRIRRAPVDPVPVSFTSTASKKPASRKNFMELDIESDEYFKDLN